MISRAKKSLFQAFSDVPAKFNIMDLAHDIHCIFTLQSFNNFGHALSNLNGISLNLYKIFLFMIYTYYLIIFFFLTFIHLHNFHKRVVKIKIDKINLT